MVNKQKQFDVRTGISKGLGQIGKGALSFLTAGMYVGTGFWKVGTGAKNTVSSAIARVAGKFFANYVPNHIIDSLF